MDLEKPSLKDGAGREGVTTVLGARELDWIHARAGAGGMDRLQVAAALLSDAVTHYHEVLKEHEAYIQPRKPGVPPVSDGAQSLYPSNAAQSEVLAEIIPIRSAKCGNPNGKTKNFGREESQP